MKNAMVGGISRPDSIEEMIFFSDYISTETP